MARMKFLCDADRCIECNACVTACKNENEVPWGINRRRVVTINDGKPGERSVSMACMHCTDAPCASVCPVTCIFSDADGIVLHSKDLCIGCGYCFYACPFGAPQYPRVGNFGSRGKMDKCTYCAGGRRPEAPGGGGGARKPRRLRGAVSCAAENAVHRSGRERRDRAKAAAAISPHRRAHPHPRSARERAHAARRAAVGLFPRGASALAGRNCHRGHGRPAGGRLFFSRADPHLGRPVGTQGGPFQWL